MLVCSRNLYKIIIMCLMAFQDYLSHVMRKPVYANNKDTYLASLIRAFVVHFQGNKIPIVAVCQFQRL